MAILTPEEWPTKVWTDAEFNSFDPSEQIDLIQPFMLAVAERIKSVHALRFKSPVNGKTYTGWQQYNTNSQLLWGNADLFGPDITGWGVGVYPLSNPAADDPTRLHPLWSPVNRIHPGYVRPTPFYRPGEAVLKGTSYVVANPHWAECFDAPVTWPDAYLRTDHSYLFNSINFSFPANSQAREDYIRDTILQYDTRFGTSWAASSGSEPPAGSFWWYHGYPASESDPTPAGEDVEASRGRILRILSPSRRLAASADADFLDEASGWQYVQMAAWLLRKYYLWPHCTHRDFTAQGIGDEVGVGIPTRFGVTPASYLGNLDARVGKYGGGGSAADRYVEVPMRFLSPPFERKHPRIIHRLDMPGTEGQVAQFRVYDRTERYFKMRPTRHPYDVVEATPDEEFVHSGKTFTHTGGAWVETPGATVDIVTTTGLIRGGDLPGGHIANDLRDFLNLLVCTTGWVVPNKVANNYVTNSSTTTFGDPCWARPSFLIRHMPAPHMQTTNNSLNPSYRMLRPLAVWNGQAALNATNVTIGVPVPNAYLANTNQACPYLQPFHTRDNYPNTGVDGPSGSANWYGARWDGEIKATHFNGESAGMNRRIEMFSWVSRVGLSAPGVGATTNATHDIKKTFTTTQAVLDGGTINTWMNAASYDGNIEDKKQHVYLAGTHRVRCWWDVAGGYKYVGSTRPAAADTITITDLV